eukprot:5030537-Pleurochrysis_carterae.AAC.1
MPATKRLSPALPLMSSSLPLFLPLSSPFLCLVLASFPPPSLSSSQVGLWPSVLAEHVCCVLLLLMPAVVMAPWRGTRRWLKLSRNSSAANCSRSTKAACEVVLGCAQQTTNMPIWKTV